jgi:hypothetical protein
LRDADVVGFGETKVFRISNQPELRKFFRNEFERTVGRIVIDNDYLGTNPGAMLAQGLEAFHYVLLGIPHYDHDGNSRHSRVLGLPWRGGRLSGAEID